MKRFIKTILIIMTVLVAMAVWGGSQSKAIAMDLCGGTGGNGQIVSIEGRGFTMKRNDDGRNQIVHLTDKTTIRTSTGIANLVDLKIGDRVTLVGGPDNDGSFTADYVFVCESTPPAEAKPAMAQRDDREFKKVSLIINTIIVVLVIFTWLNIVAWLRLVKKESWAYLLLFSIFYVYLYKVIDLTILQFQSLLVLRQFVPNLMLRGASAGKAINLIPLLTLRAEDIKTSLLNVLMMIPFGFGLPFITKWRFKKIVTTGLGLSLLIEFLQFISGFIAQTTFRVADANDLIFNTAGAAIGYGMWLIFRHLIWAKTTP